MAARRSRIVLGLAASAGAAALLVPTANAGGGLLGGLLGGALPSCGATSQPFAQFGDGNAYCAPANNGFESGSRGWTLSRGASVVSANEPWYVGGFGTHALDLAPGASATSPAIPISLLDPYFRLFARSVGADGGLRVQVSFHGLTGNLTGLLNVGEFASGPDPDWQPTQLVPSLLALPLGTSSAQLTVTSLASQGSWQIDDVYVDPWVSRVG